MKKVLFFIIAVLLLFVVGVYYKAVFFSGNREENAALYEKREENSLLSENKAGDEISEHKKASFDITFTDARGNRQKMNTGGVDKKDTGTKLCWHKWFVESNHFYFIKNEEKNTGKEYCKVWKVYQDKGKKLGEFTMESEYIHDEWGKYKDKLYLVFNKLTDATFDSEKRMVIVDLKSFETRMIDFSESYDNFYVYKEKLYYDYENNLGVNMVEMNLNGKKLRTIPLGNSADRVSVSGIMDEKIYFLTCKKNRYLFTLKSKDMITGEVKDVMQYEQPAYDRKKWEHTSSDLYLSGGNLFVLDEFCDRNKSKENEKYADTLYMLPIKNGEKLKCVYKKKIVHDVAFANNTIYFIDEKQLLHRMSIDKGVDRIVSKRKFQEVCCVKGGLFTNEYKARVAEDEDAVEPDVIFYMSFEGKHEKKVAEID